jgi:4-hydroxy-4-methyl-2-oxoglutarate aldolase
VTAGPDPRIAELADIGTSTIYEARGRRGLVDASFIQLLPGTSVAGPARIAACGQDDNWAVHAVMSRVHPGDVLVLRMPEPRPIALVGDLLLTQAKAQGAAGVLVDASVRDVDDLRELGLPVWTRWVRSHGATKDVPGELDVPVEVAGTTIAPGDLVVMDADGIAVVPASELDEALELGRARLAKEATLREKLQAGELSYELHGLRQRELELGVRR